MNTTAQGCSSPHHPSTMTDDELVALINAGDAEAGLAELQTRYMGKVLRRVRHLVKDAHLSQDITQEVFVKIFLKSHLYRQGTNFSAWLLEIARNQALSALRSRARQPRPVSSLSTANDDGHTVLEILRSNGHGRDAEERELAEVFRKAVEALPEHYRQIFQMCVCEEIPYAVASRMLSLPSGTVAIRIMRARQRLFQAMEPHLDRLRRPPACFK